MKKIAALCISLVVVAGSSVSAFATPVTNSGSDHTGDLLPEEEAASQWEDDFSDLVTESSVQYAEKYAGAGIGEDRESAWIWFTGGVPNTILEKARNSHSVSAPDTEGTTVIYQVDSSASSAREALYGGGYLSNCTAGFSIRKSGVTENGLVTAGHCVSPQRYGANGQISLTQKGTYIGGSGDISIYHADSGWTAPQFYYAPGKLRNINSVNDTYIGQKICVNGKTTANHCTTVFSVNNCGAGACGLTATNAYVTQPGDSGAPWFWKNVGYGIHQGRITVNGAPRSVFTPILKAQQLLGFQVKLS